MDNERQASTHEYNANYVDSTHNS